MRSVLPFVLVILAAIMLPLGSCRLFSFPAGKLDLFSGKSFTMKAATFTRTPVNTSSVASRSAFTEFSNRFFRGPTVLKVEVVGSAETCIDLCSQDSRCELWSWCPLNYLAGCEVLNFGDLATTTTTTTTSTTGMMAYGSCILSARMRLGAKEYIFMDGDDVEWTGGYYDPAMPPSPTRSPSLPSPSPSPGPRPSPTPTPTPAPVASPIPSPSPSPAPSPPPTPLCSEDGCPCHETENFTIPAGDNTVNWPIGITLRGSNPECFDVETQSFVRSPPSYAACNSPSSNPVAAVMEMAVSLCNGTTAESNLEFANQVLKGGSAAETAVAGLLYAQTELSCFEGSEILNIISPPMSLVQDRVFSNTVANMISYFTSVANGSERAGMGLCVVINSNNGTEGATATVLATVHTGIDS